jgi:hypothetical protein
LDASLTLVRNLLLIPDPPNDPTCGVRRLHEEFVAVLEAENFIEALVALSDDCVQHRSTVTCLLLLETVCLIFKMHDRVLLLEQEDLKEGAGDDWQPPRRLPNRPLHTALSLDDEEEEDRSDQTMQTHVRTDKSKRMANAHNKRFGGTFVRVLPVCTLSSPYLTFLGWLAFFGPTIYCQNSDARRNAKARSVRRNQRHRIGFRLS